MSWKHSLVKLWPPRIAFFSCVRFVENYGIYIGGSIEIWSGEIIQPTAVIWNFDRIGRKTFMSRARARSMNHRQQTFRYGSARIWSFVFHLKSVYAVVVVLNTNQCQMIIIKIFLFYFRCRPKNPMLSEQLMDINARHAGPTSAGRNLFMRPQKCVTTTENSNMSTSNDLIRFCALIPLQITHQHIITLCASQSFQSATTTRRDGIEFDFRPLA